MFRAGLILEQLEFSFQGSYLRNSVTEEIGNVEDPFIKKGFNSNILGVKYLIYDPYKYGTTKKVDIRSWKANKKFNFKRLIPAVSAFAGASFISKNNDFAFHNNIDYRATKIEPTVSPKILIAAQNNWTEQLVFVSNFVFDKITTEFFDFRFVFTTTYNFKGRWAVLGEYELANSKIYKDNIFRAGGTYLINNDFQLDASLQTGTKDTPYIIGANAGVSYRLDFHKPQDDLRIKTGEMKEIEDDIEQIKEDIEDGLLPPETMKGKYRGVNLEDYVDKEDENSEFESTESDSIPKKKRWWQRIGSKRKRFKKSIKETADVSDDSLEVSTKKVLGTGGRISEFADEEFLEEKRESIRPKERTPEEQAALDARIEAEKAKMSKRKRRKLEPLIDPLTDEPFTEEELELMSKKEKRRLRKEQEEIKMLDDELQSLMNETQNEMSARELARAQKKKAKEARKNAKKNKNTDDIEQEITPTEANVTESDSSSTEDQIDPKAAKAAEKARLKEEKRKAKEAKKKEKEEAKQKKEETDEENSTDW